MYDWGTWKHTDAAGELIASGVLYEDGTCDEVCHFPSHVNALPWNYFQLFHSQDEADRAYIRAVARRFLQTMNPPLRA